MTTGIIGAGGIGQAIAGHLVAAGCEIIVSNSRDPKSLAEVVKRLGPLATAGTRQDAAQAEIVVLAVPWPQVNVALSDLPPWSGRILIDATNPVVEPDLVLAPLAGRTSSEIVASLAHGARVVKACNTLPRALLSADPRKFGGHRVMFMSGDDTSAKARVGELLEKLGFAAIDLGGLASGGQLQQFPSGPLPTLNLVKLG